jgi:hypothetical protein
MAIHAQMAKRVWFVTATLITLSASSSWMMPPASEQEEDTARMLKDTRWAEAASKQGRTAKKTAGPTYSKKTASLSAARVDGRTLVGVTLWRLRPPKTSDVGERLLVLDGGRQSQWIPERIEVDTPLHKEERVRLAIEAARLGYLYVIDREQYVDGRFGEPYLIFPSKLVRNGQNEVRPGRLIEIPGQQDTPNAFKLQPSQADQIGEELSILITPTVLEQLAITDKPLLLSRGQLANWEKQWGSHVGRLEMIGGAGQVWTRPEKEAAANPERLLTPTDPAPQTLFFRSDAKEDEPVMVKINLSYAKRSAPP